MLPGLHTNTNFYNIILLTCYQVYTLKLLNEYNK